MFLDISLTGYTITDECINRANSTALALNHATIRTIETTVVRTAKAGGGTLLVLNTDYTISEADTDLGTLAGVAVYRKIAIINGTYQNVKLYVSYKTCGDYVNAEMMPSAGEMEMWPSDTIKVGRWLWCRGEAIDRELFADLFAIIGVDFGVGDGSTTFNLPDMREATPQGAGTYSAVTGTTHSSITSHDARAVAAFADDQGQGHWHDGLYESGGNNPIAVFQSDASVGSGIYVVGIGDGSSLYVRDPAADNHSNGTPRTGTVTRGKTMGLNFIIRY